MKEEQFYTEIFCNTCHKAMKVYLSPSYVLQRFLVCSTVGCSERGKRWTYNLETGTGTRLGD